MLFNSTEFLIFFAAFALLYWLCRGSLRLRNLLVVGASWLFYGWWDWRFLGLLILSSLVDYHVALRMAASREEFRRRRWLAVSLVFNLGLLGVFKYLGFFLESFHVLLGQLGVEHPAWSWNVVLPVGISFYTFQTLSYSLDVHARRLEPVRDLPAFLAFVSFFPQLVAGPIERASHLLPQFLTPRLIHRQDLEEGLGLVLWGLFKKVVFADQLAPFAELGFRNTASSAPLLLLGVLAFAGQIYGDFSGYSDIARGLARALGFDLMRNFDRPYTAVNIREFWRRWHISLSTWLRDYLYIPLGGSRLGPVRTALNLLLTMLLGGLWHGAAWPFVLWGAWHGLALVVHRHWPARLRPPPFIGWALTLATVAYGWLLFRAGTWSEVVRLHQTLLHWQRPDWLPSLMLGVTAWWLPVLVVERVAGGADEVLTGASRRFGWLRAFGFALLLLVIAAYWQPEATPFLYFQF